MLFTFAAIQLLNPFGPGHRHAAADTSQAEPEASTGSETKNIVSAKSFMIAAANPLAASTGRDILARNGSAIDAAIAAQMILNLVEPQSSGIGGGAFILHWDQKSHTIESYDARETAPISARPDRFLEPGGQPKKFKEAVFSGLSIGVPGLLRGLELAHKKHGKLTWPSLFVPAIELAEKGFPVSQRLHEMLTEKGAENFGPIARNYFFNDRGEALPVGHILTNPAFAQVLREIANKGADEFYLGKLANDIVDRISKLPTIPGDISLTDMAIYQARERNPICSTYRKFKVCGMGPPSSGALTISQTLKLIEPFELGTTPLNPKAIHMIAEAQKLAYADRARYMADSDFINVPSGLLDATYVDSRRLLIDPGQAMKKAEPGQPESFKKSQFGKDETIESSGTSHISIVDAFGNAVSMTTTIESAFGSGFMVRGFLLNNELTDFSFRPSDSNGRLIANSIQPGKRPRSSMAPTLIFDENNNVVMVLGSPGGSRIILYVLKTLVGHVDWKLDIQAAINLPNFGSRNGPLEIEEGPDAKKIADLMLEFGQVSKIRPMTSGVQAIVRRDGLLYGAADPRREGVAMGN